MVWPLKWLMKLYENMNIEPNKPKKVCKMLCLSLLYEYYAVKIKTK